MNPLHLLAPSADEIERLARRETDPKLARHFEPLAIGPLPTIVTLGLIGLVAALIAPFRMLIALLKRRP